MILLVLGVLLYCKDAYEIIKYFYVWRKEVFQNLIFAFQNGLLMVKFCQTSFWRVVGKLRKLVFLARCRFHDVDRRYQYLFWYWCYKAEYHIFDTPRGRRNRWKAFLDNINKRYSRLCPFRIREALHSLTLVGALWAWAMN